MQKQPTIAVIGGNQCTDAEAQIAERVGKLIAERNAILICGGRGGIMQAACKGAFESGGITVGILPGEDTASANPFVKIPVATGLGIARNIVIIRSADAVIAIAGKYGTLSEIAFAMQLGKPVFSLGSWPEIPGVQPVDSPDSAVQQAFDYLAANNYI